MACLSPSQHLFNSFIVDFDDSDPVPLQHNNKHFIKHSGSIPPSPSITPELTLAHPGDTDPKADSIKAGAALGMTLSPSLALPHAALSSPSDSASPLSPPNSDSTSSSNASPAVPLLSLDSASHSSLSPPANSAAGTPSAVVKSESASEGLSPNLTMELGLPGQQPAGTGRMPPDLSRQQAAGKGGCWTCRIRRKKCDEIRVGDSCSTCIRLTIDCLGWGPKRPAWMRDKQAVERYKAGIKEKLIREGKVRGQPRPQPNPQTSTMSTPQRQLSGPSMSRGGGSPIGYPPAGPSFLAGGPTSSSAQAQHAHGQRYGPYPSPTAFGHPQLHPHFQPHLQAQHTPPTSMMYSSSPSTPSSTLSTLAGGGGMDYFALESQQLQGHQGPMRRATVSVPVSRHLHTQERVLEHRRRAYLEQQSALHLQPSGGSHRGPTHVYGGPANEQNFGTLDLSGPALGEIGGIMTRTNDSLSSSSSLDVTNMNLASTYTSSGLAGSPLILPTDNATFSGGYMTSQHQYQYANRPSRSGSGSTTSSTPSSNSHLQLAPGISNPARSVPPPSLNDALMDQTLVEPHIQYHFENVLPMQYVFSSEKAHGILQTLIALDPFGPVTNSSCALAALHNKTVRVAQGFDQPDNTTANQFFDRAYWQLINAGSRGSSIQGTSASINPPNSGFTEADALAAIQLIGFFLLREGHGDWQTHLETAREWMIQTGLPAEENADTKATFANMNETQKFTVKMVIWYDIFAAICLHQSPRFLSMYRRLLRNDSNTVNHDDGSSTSGSASSVRMDLLMGCPDEVLLILAETADLAQWKRQERRLGTLSTRDLLRRGEAIELMLRDYISAASAMQVQHMRPPRPSGEHNAPSLDALLQSKQMDVVRPVTDTAGASESTATSSRPATTHTVTTAHIDSIASEPASESGTNMSITAGASSSTLELTMQGSSSSPIAAPLYGRQSVLQSNQDDALPETNHSDIAEQISAVFQETAALFLQSIINDPSPGVPEIKHSVDRLFAALQSLPTTIDRALVLPFVLAGCLTNDASQGSYVRSRLSNQDETFGNVRATRLLIETVWQSRKQNIVADWRDVMRDQLGIQLLLV